MQAVIALPADQKLRWLGDPHSFLLRRICGVPLIVRVVATAVRAGATEVLFLSSEAYSLNLEKVIAQHLSPEFLAGVKIVQQARFDPNSPVAWKSLGGELQGDFLWIPWNWVTHIGALRDLTLLRFTPASWSKPAHVLREAVRSPRSGSAENHIIPEGVSVISESFVRDAERFLVMHSGKALDGIHTKFNRWLCRPLVRLLAHTGATPNMVTLGGLLCAIFSAVSYARGMYSSSVVGALLLFLSGLFHEADGMLARIKFTDSPFGCWFESLVDNASYALLFTGITLGLALQRDSKALLLGALLLFGCALSIGVIGLQHRATTRPDSPNEYPGMVYRLLESDSHNWILGLTRRLHFLTKKGVLIHYVLMFTVAGLLPSMIWLALIGSHATWIIALYLNHRFFPTPRHSRGFSDCKLRRKVSSSDVYKNPCLIGYAEPVLAREGCFAHNSDYQSKRDGSSSFSRASGRALELNQVSSSFCVMTRESHSRAASCSTSSASSRKRREANLYPW